MRTFLILALLSFTTPSLQAKASLQAEPAASRFKPKLTGTFYVGAAGQMVAGDQSDVKDLLGPFIESVAGIGVSGNFHLGYQFASGWAAELGWESFNRYVEGQLQFSGYGSSDISYVFAEKTWFVEPLYRILFGRHFTLGLGLQMGLTDDKLTENYAGSTSDALGRGWELMPELRAEVIMGRLASWQFNVGYRMADASPIEDGGTTVHAYRAGGNGADWHLRNSGWAVGLGINFYLGYLTTSPGPRQGKGNVTIPVNIEGAENLPAVREWTLQIVDLKGKIVKEFEGKGPVPRVLSWDALGPKGRPLNADDELRLRLSTTDAFGASSITEAGYGDTLQPRAFQASAPLLSVGDDGRGGLMLSTQFKHSTPQVKAWKLKITDAEGKVLKVFEGKEVLPRALKWNGLDAAGDRVAGKDLRYNFEATDENGPVFGEDGQAANAIKPRQLMAKPPRYDVGAGQIVFMPETGLKVAVRSWTLSLKAADGKILKVINGEGPLPKEFRFKPEELAAEGVNLGKLDSGAAFIQYSLVTVDQNGTQTSASDALALDDEFGEGALSAGDYTVKRGKELLILAKPNLLSGDPGLSKKGSFLMAAPEIEGLKSWRLMISDSAGRSLREFKGAKPMPSTLLWDGKDSHGEPAKNPSTVSYAFFATGSDGVEKKSERVRTLTRSFKYEGKGVKVQRVHAAWFAKGESEIQPEMFGRLERVADWLNKSSDAKVLIQGHSSKEGDSRTNDRLALERATTVKGWFVEVKKVTESRIQIRGYGTRLLLDEGDSEDAVRRNRRIDVLLLEWPE